MLLFFPYQPTPWFSEDTNWVSNSLIPFDTNHLESAQTRKMKDHARLRMPVPSMWALERWPVCMCASCHSAVFDSLRPYGLWPASLLCPWNFPARILEWRCHFLLQGLFPTSQPRDQAHISCISWLAGGFFTDEPPGKSWVLTLLSNFAAMLGVPTTPPA